MIDIDAGVDIGRFAHAPHAEAQIGDATTDHVVYSTDQDHSIVFRSFFSQQPMFLEWVAATARFRLRGLNSLEAADEAIDIEWLANYVAYQVPLTLRTWRRGLNSIRPGMHVEIDRRSGDIDFKFPDLPPPPNRFQSAAKAEDTICQRLAAQLSRCDPSRSVFHLSAGLDSSLLLLLAKRIHGNIKIRAVTFEARGRGASDELETVQRLTDDAGLSLMILDFRDIDIWSCAKRMMAAYKSPVGHPSSLARYLLDEAVAATRPNAIVTGRGADELFAGYPWHLPQFNGPAHHDRVRASPPDLMHALFPRWQRDAEKNYNSFFSHSYSLDRRLQYDLATLGSDWSFIDSQLSRHFGVKMIAPFCDAELQIAACALPPQAKVAGGRQKVVLRQLFKDLYPAYLLDQPKRGLSFDISAYLREYTVKEILRQLNLDWLDTTGLVLSRPTLQKMLDDTLAGTANYGWQIWSIHLAGLLGGNSGVRNRER